MWRKKDLLMNSIEFFNIRSHWDWLVNSWPRIYSIARLASVFRSGSSSRWPTRPVRSIRSLTVCAKNRIERVAGSFILFFFFFSSFHSTAIFLLGLFCLFVCLLWPDLLRDGKRRLGNEGEKTNHWFCACISPCLALYASWWSIDPPLTFIHRN